MLPTSLALQCAPFTRRAKRARTATVLLEDGCERARRREACVIGGAVASGQSFTPQGSSEAPYTDCRQKLMWYGWNAGRLLKQLGIPIWRSSLSRGLLGRIRPAAGVSMAVRHAVRSDHVPRGTV